MSTIVDIRRLKVNRLTAGKETSVVSDRTLGGFQRGLEALKELLLSPRNEP